MLEMDTARPEGASGSWQRTAAVVPVAQAQHVGEQ
jgi:hypothetical protein